MIRDAREDDSRAIAEIIVSAWQHAYDGVIDPSHPGTMQPGRYIDIMETNIREKREKILVWEETDNVVGFISGRLLKEESGPEAGAAFVSEGSCGAGYSAEVVGLYIRPEFQGCGIGSRLLTEMKAFFRRRGCGSLIIWTLLGARNNDFYLKHGGSPLEHKDLEIGGKLYRGVGFVFTL
ncbi:MAG: GNAT family N-acetyltransferase [Sediminispirochaetaceae bacterium]